MTHMPKGQDKLLEQDEIHGFRAGGVTPADEIFERLRNAMLDQRLPPGMQLKEQDLADAFRVNRPVIRHVLNRLVNCRLVMHRPNRGIFVARPTVQEGRDIFSVRMLIESAVVEVLINRVTDQGIATLRDIVQREQSAYKENRMREALHLSIDFHLMLARLAGNTVLEQYQEELVARTPLVVLSYKRMDLMTCALNEHSDIVEAIAKRDTQQAVALMKKHIQHLQMQLDLEAKKRNKGGNAADIFDYDSFT